MTETPLNTGNTMPDAGEYTPGPWMADGPDYFGDYTIHPEGRALAIAAVVNGAINGLSGHGAEHEANARLIAAAPELLTSLEFAVKLLAPFGETAQVEHMRSVIAKARGIPTTQPSAGAESAIKAQEN